MRKIDRSGLDASIDQTSLIGNGQRLARIPVDGVISHLCAVCASHVDDSPGRDHLADNVSASPAFLRVSQCCVDGGDIRLTGARNCEISCNVVILIWRLMGWVCHVCC